MSRNNTQCMRCDRPIRFTFWDAFKGRVALCPTEDLNGCVALAAALRGVPDDPDPDPELDPPEDINVCPGCKGAGEVYVRQDWQTGAIETATCMLCGGLGEVTPEWYAPMTAP